MVQSRGQGGGVWTQQTLTPENIEYIRNLPQGPLTVDGFQIIHGSPLDEDEYMIGASDAAQLFSYLATSVAFFGHTHLQGGFIWNHSRIEMIGKPGPRRSEEVLEIDPECAYMINPGSVGQPRDADARAAYAVYDPEARQLTYCRYNLRRGEGAGEDRAGGPAAAAGGTAGRRPLVFFVGQVRKTVLRRVSLLFRDDLVFDLRVCGGRDDLFIDQLILGPVRTAGDNLGAVCFANPGKASIARPWRS